MATRFSRTILLLSVQFCSSFAFSQSTTPAKEEDEFAKKKPETKITEVVPTDSMAAGELMKRAVGWIKAESIRYRKSSGTTTGSKAECTASFPIKPKELNPEVDYTGKIMMKVLIEVKDSKYRYTVYDIRHESKNGRTTAGSIDNVVPECGSQAMHDIVFKKLKGEALRDAAIVVADLKKGMSELPEEKKDDEW